MAENGFKALNPDMHVIEPEDLWQRYIDQAFKDRGPKGTTRWPGDMLVSREGRFESPELKLEPEEYFQRQCYVSVEADEEPAKFVEQSDVANTVVFSTDYPHIDSMYPHAVDTFLSLPFFQDTKRKNLWHNCARLYSFSDS